MSRRQAVDAPMNRTKANLAQAFLPVRLRTCEERAPARMPVPRNMASVRNFGHLARIQAVQKISRIISIEQRIIRLDSQKKAVPRCQSKSRHIEDGMIRHRQAA